MPQKYNHWKAGWCKKTKGHYHISHRTQLARRCYDLHQLSVETRRTVQAVPVTTTNQSPWQPNVTMAPQWMTRSCCYDSWYPWPLEDGVAATLLSGRGDQVKMLLLGLQVTMVTRGQWNGRREGCWPGSQTWPPSCRLSGHLGTQAEKGVTRVSSLDHQKEAIWNRTRPKALLQKSP